MDPETQAAWDKMFPKVAEPRAFTPEEIRDKFLDYVHSMADYWAEVALEHERDTVRERCDGLAFSILAMIDGSNVGLPSFDVVTRPHEDDKAFAIAGLITGSRTVRSSMQIVTCTSSTTKRTERCRRSTTSTTVTRRPRQSTSAGRRGGAIPSP